MYINVKIDADDLKNMLFERLNALYDCRKICCDEYDECVKEIIQAMDGGYFDGVEFNPKAMIDNYVFNNWHFIPNAEGEFQHDTNEEEVEG